MKKIISLAVALFVALLGIVILAGPVSAHTPKEGADCQQGVWVHGTNWPQGDTVKVYVDNVLKASDTAGSDGKLDATVPAVSDTNAHPWKVVYDSRDDQYDQTKTGTYGPCVTVKKDGAFTKSVTQSDCHTGAVLTYSGTGVDFSGPASGVSGPQNVTVTAKPKTGHEWTNGGTETRTVFSGALAGPLDADSDVCATADASVQVNTTPGACRHGGSASLGTLLHATLVGSLDLTPGTHTATFNADAGHRFADGSKTKTVTYTVPDRDNGKCAPCTACHLPKFPHSQGVLDCRGIYNGGTYTRVVVRANHDCTLVDVKVNGSIYANHASDLRLGNVTVRGSVFASHIVNTFQFGATNGTCNADPMVGGSVYVVGSHNVVICKAQVCHKIVVKGSTGRVIVKATRVNKLVVTGNNAFRADSGNVHHGKLHAIRLYSIDAHQFVIRDNKREVLKHNLHHVARIGGSKFCRLV